MPTSNPSKVFTFATIAGCLAVAVAVVACADFLVSHPISVKTLVENAASAALDFAISILAAMFSWGRWLTWPLAIMAVSSLCLLAKERWLEIDDKSPADRPLEIVACISMASTVLLALVCTLGRSAEPLEQTSLFGSHGAVLASGFLVFIAAIGTWFLTAVLVTLLFHLFDKKENPPAYLEE